MPRVQWHLFTFFPRSPASQTIVGRGRYLFLSYQAIHFGSVCWPWYTFVACWKRFHQNRYLCVFVSIKVEADATGRWMTPRDSQFGWFDIHIIPSFLDYDVDREYRTILKLSRATRKPQLGMGSVVFIWKMGVDLFSCLLRYKYRPHLWCSGEINNRAVKHYVYEISALCKNPRCASWVTCSTRNENGVWQASRLNYFVALSHRSSSIVLRCTQRRFNYNIFAKLITIWLWIPQQMCHLQYSYSDASRGP